MGGKLQGLRFKLEHFYPGDDGTWSTVDSFQFQGRNSWPLAMAADASGHVFVGSEYGGRWVVRKN
jgi:hypothetical protein